MPFSAPVTMAAVAIMARHYVRDEVREIADSGALSGSGGAILADVLSGYERTSVPKVASGSSRRKTIAR
ncbi:MAG: hypothetical protein JWO62_99 [Acidimicrobiaceae bacterium]|nr:hypothetical protein [Acidimicrobiaceae bacterium]